MHAFHLLSSIHPSLLYAFVFNIRYFTFYSIQRYNIYQLSTCNLLSHSLKLLACVRIWNQYLFWNLFLSLWKSLCNEMSLPQKEEVKIITRRNICVLILFFFCFVAWPYERYRWKGGYKKYKAEKERKSQLWRFILNPNMATKQSFRNNEWETVWRCSGIDRYTKIILKRYSIDSLVAAIALLKLQTLTYWYFKIF